MLGKTLPFGVDPAAPGGRFPAGFSAATVRLENGKHSLMKVSVSL